MAKSFKWTYSRLCKCQRAPQSQPMAATPGGILKRTEQFRIQYLPHHVHGVAPTLQGSQNGSAEASGQPQEDSTSSMASGKGIANPLMDAPDNVLCLQLQVVDRMSWDQNTLEMKTSSLSWLLVLKANTYPWTMSLFQSPSVFLSWSAMFVEALFSSVNGKVGDFSMDPTFAS